MANWKHKIDIAKAWRDAKIGELETHELAHIISKKLSELNLDDDFELEQIIDDFSEMDETTEIDEFDYRMYQLYNWAGNDHMCWIGTL